ncbi:MAG: YIP1 family protein, partial [Bacteroidales bacterium]|nr:YIP1 family protein [Bacteroidales bacterium]
MSNENFSLQKFIEDSKNAVLNPKEHFTTLSTTGGFGEPVIKAVIYGFIAGVFALLWSLLNISGGSGLGGLFGGAVGIMAFVGAIIGALIGLFIGGVIVLIISAICSGSNDYEANVRVVAAMMILTPINAFLNVFNGISPALGSIIGLIVNLYGLWMLYHALNQTLKAKEETSKIIALVLGALLLLFAIIGFGTRKKLNKWEKKLGDYENISKEFEKSAKKMAENFEEAAKEMAEGKEDMAEIYGDTEGDYEFEMANGETVKNINPVSVTMALKSLDEDNNFAILSKGDSFVQAAVGEEGYVVEYRDDSGYFRSVEPSMSYEKVVVVFIGFLNDGDSWKEITE